MQVKIWGISFFIWVTGSLVFTGCEKEKQGNDIQHVNTIQDGCFNIPGDQAEKKSVTNLEKPKFDTTFYFFKGDTIVFYVETSYYCCTPFTTNHEIKSDSIIMNIYDNCTPFKSPCYCYCTCNYSFEYMFKNLEPDKSYYYEVNLHAPDSKSPNTIGTGMVNLFSDAL